MDKPSPPYLATTPRRPRRAGRPAATAKDSRDHREALIDAAREEFAAHGFAATSLRQVALAAKVTPALANYYFRDKAGLLDAVMDSRVVPLVQALAGSVLAAGSDPKTAIVAFVRHYTATAAANPWLPQLIVREVLNSEGALRETFPQRFAGGIAAMLRGLVAAGKESGAFRRDLDTSEIVMSIVSLCIFPFVATPLVNGALGIDTSPARASALADHHLAVLLAGIAGPP
jgi:TetR/AcrR family transcriptional regulator